MKKLVCILFMGLIICSTILAQESDGKEKNTLLLSKKWLFKVGITDVALPINSSGYAMGLGLSVEKRIGNSLSLSINAREYFGKTSILIPTSSPVVLGQTLYFKETRNFSFFKLGAELRKYVNEESTKTKFYFTSGLILEVPRKSNRNNPAVDFLRNDIQQDAVINIGFGVQKQLGKLGLIDMNLGPYWDGSNLRFGYNFSVGIGF